MYDDFLSEIYDDIYVLGLGKDYHTEAEQIVQVVGQFHPAASSLLDVGCGTGLHLVHLRKHFDHIEGLEISPGMLRRAQVRLPGVPLHAGDMRSFHIGHKFDVITCLFAVAGFVATLEELRQEMQTMTRHLKPGGVLIIEPWHSPETWSQRSGRVSHVVAKNASRTVVRMTHSTTDGRLSRKQAAYVVGDQSGLRFHQHEHTLILATPDEYCEALVTAGCSEVFDLPGRDQYQRRVVGRVPQLGS